MFQHVRANFGLNCRFDLSPAAKRAAVVALIVGVALNVVNGFFESSSGGKMVAVSTILFFTSPFVTVLISQYFGVQAACRFIDASRTRTPVTIGELLTRRGVLGRAVCVGLAVAALNSSFLAISGFVTNQHAEPPDAALLAQSFLLPIGFSILSQIGAFRRQTAALLSSQNLTALSKG